MNAPNKKLPDFKTEAKERAFWQAKGRDSTEYIDWSTACKAAFPNLKPTANSAERKTEKR
jgi:hypothetical protein